VKKVPGTLDSGRIDSGAALGVLIPLSSAAFRQCWKTWRRDRHRRLHHFGPAARL